MNNVRSDAGLDNATLGYQNARNVSCISPDEFPSGYSAMYRYQPPKSSNWGHSLRNMQPSREKALFSDFVARVVAQYSFLDGILLMANASQREVVQHFERLLGTTVGRDGATFALTPQQCQQCLDEIVADAALRPRLLLAEVFGISMWSINGEAIVTDSRIHLQYGIKPWVSTFLQFETVEQFHYVKRVLEDLGFCKLNEKHLRSSKRGGWRSG